MMVLHFVVRILRVSEHCAHFAKASHSAQHSTCHVAQPRGLHLFGPMLPKAASAPPNCLAATPLPDVMIVRMVPRDAARTLCALRALPHPLRQKTALPQAAPARRTTSPPHLRPKGGPHTIIIL